MSTIRNRALALGLATAMASAAPAAAAPVPSSTTALKQAASTDVVDIQWRGGPGWRGGHWRGGGWGRGAAAAGLGLAAGALIGGAIANSYGGPYGYYDGAYAYEPGYYGGPIYGAPATVYAVPRAGRCWVSTGHDGRYGYWAAC